MESRAKLNVNPKEGKMRDSEKNKERSRADSASAAELAALRQRIAELEAAVARRKQAEEQLEVSLRKKVVLLQEIHHRVKNNLQVISSLLDLQSATIQDPQAVQAFRESRDRIKAIALVYDSLYRTQDVARIDMGEYIQSEVSHLFIAYGLDGAVAADVQVDDVSLDVDVAIPCGLIVNELVTNALKYAFPARGSRVNGKENKVCIKLRAKACEIAPADEQCPRSEFTLVVRDNGVGLPTDVDPENPSSLGLQLVDVLTKQIGGTVEVDRSKGTAFKITFAEQSP